MKYLRLKQLLEPTIKAVESEDPTLIEKDNLLYTKLSLAATIVLGAAGVIVAWKYGNISESLAKEQTALAKKQDTSKQMIAAQQQIISILSKDVKLNEDVKSANENANKFRFIGAIFKLGGSIGDSANAMKLMTIDGGTKQYADKILPILEGQLNNPFLCADSLMLRRWDGSYIRLLLISAEVGEELFLTDNGQYYVGTNGQPLITTRSASPLDKVAKTEFSSYFFNVWKYVDGTYAYCGKRMGRDIQKILKK